ncbi:MAG TPA: roadblock/LC7 domain-containing protein, partial [Chloroflexia bacterium]
MQDLLSKFRAIRGVGMAAVVGSDGLVIESVHRPELDADALAAVATNGLLLAEALGRQMERGGALQTIIEYEGGVVLIEPLLRRVLPRGDRRRRAPDRRGLSRASSTCKR